MQALKTHLKLWRSLLINGGVKLIKEGEFNEKKGATTLKLVGDIATVNKVELIKKVKEDLLKRFPYSATQLCAEIKTVCPKSKQNDVWRIIRENDIKTNYDYSVYNFRNKQQRENYIESEKLATGCPSIYNQSAIDFISNILKQEKE